MSTPRYDVRALLRAVGDGAGHGGLGERPERPEPEFEADVLDQAQRVTSAPLEVAGFLDGIQAGVTLAYRMFRPVYLAYVAAGALGHKGAVLGLDEDLFLAVSGDDEEWARALPGGVPVEVLEHDSPFEVGAAAKKLVDMRRDELERDLVTELLEKISGTIVVDGSLAQRPIDPRVVGVVKTTATRYLRDESSIASLRSGWRSERFVIPAGVGASRVARFSCYLRLREQRYGPWDYGLIRVESYDADVLDALCARCLSERQGRGSNDPRGDRHLTTIAAVENLLRGRRPYVFDALRSA